jgi:hypothetical protein
MGVDFGGGVGTAVEETQHRPEYSVGVHAPLVSILFDEVRKCTLRIRTAVQDVEPDAGNGCVPADICTPAECSRTL